MRRSTRIRAVPPALPVVAAVKTEATAVAGRTLQIARKSDAALAVGKRSLSVSALKRESSAPTKKIKSEVDSLTTASVLKLENGSSSPLSSVGIKKEKAESSDWHDLCAVRELSCVVTLTSGQVFTWKRYVPESDAWIGVVGKHVYKLRERDHRVQYQIVHPVHLSTEQATATLHEYFRLEIEAASLYAKWTEKDDDMSKIIQSLPGLRIIRQDPVECLFAFICSSNNNIQRITQMITKLKATYGKLLYHDPVSDEQFFAFPSVDTLAARGEEQTLRDLGFGYRAPFIIKSSALLQERGGLDFLLELRESPASGNEDEYAEKLMEFSGVGRKVADCIGLFALNKLHAIPVDTHVWQIACREFDPSLKDKKSITPTVYQAVGDHFRRRFSPLAGWAHSVLFTGDLSSFKDHLPKEMQQQQKKMKTPAKKKPSSINTDKTAATKKPKASTRERKQTPAVQGNQRT